MENEISTTQGLNQTQIALLSRTIAKGATPDELSMFVGMCKRTGLDPFTRQIYFIKVGTKVMTQISIDGFRVIAERSGLYAGQDAPIFEEDENGKIKSCSVNLYRWHGDTRYQASVGVAYMAEYSKGSGNWATMPRTMISKVAECIALRKAFPNDLSGLYSPEEMEQAQLSPKMATTDDEDYLDTQSHEVVATTSPQAIKPATESAGLGSRLCCDCDKPYTPKPGSESYSKKCVTCYYKNGKDPIDKSSKPMPISPTTAQVDDGKPPFEQPVIDEDGNGIPF